MGRARHAASAALRNDQDRADVSPAPVGGEANAASSAVAAAGGEVPRAKEAQPIQSRRKGLHRRQYRRIGLPRPQPPLMLQECLHG
jgi:hypothetical protein